MSRLLLLALSSLLFTGCVDGCAAPPVDDAGTDDAGVAPPVDGGDDVDGGANDGGVDDDSGVVVEDGGIEDGGVEDSGVVVEDGGVVVEDAGVDAGDPGLMPDGGLYMSGLDARPANPTCVAPAPPPSTSGVQLTRVHDQLSLVYPLSYQDVPGTNDKIVLQRLGTIVKFDGDGDGSDASVFFDVTSTVGAGSSPNSESGLLGLAFHPDYVVNGEVYVHYMRNDGGRRSRIARFTRGNDGNIDMATEETLLEVAQPAANHNGGDMAFGPDGLLYIALGDGGGRDDQYGNGQDPDTLLGSILRIDVDTVQAPLAYAIPADNPFAMGGGAPEIYAWGLRNPWRMSFDTATGQLYTGDVGQNAWEEVDIIVNGGNYGWNTREGKHCFSPASGCDDIFVEPIWDYVHPGGANRSITGGYVYRGSNIPTLVGKYIFADFVTGEVWALSDDTGDWDAELILDSGRPISTFGQDQDGEVFLVDYSGSIWRFDAAAPVMSTFPTLLSQTGCFDATNPALPVDGVIPFDVQVELWSDGAAKERFLAIPDGTSITTNAAGDFRFPNGTVLAKHFRLQGQLIETRLFMRHDDGNWAGYSYRWNDAQTDAELLPSALLDDTRDQTWAYPSRGDCMRCHTEASDFALGPEVRQLNAPMTYPSTGRTANQLDTLKHIGLVDDGVGQDLEPFPLQDDAAASLDTRARALLHVNCASCHQQDHPIRAQFDVRFGAPLTTYCDVEPGLPLSNLEVPNAHLLAPGSKESSTLWVRMGIRGLDGMPAIGSLVVDDDGRALLGQWIDGMNGCP